MTSQPKRFMACLLAITLATAPMTSRPADLNAEMQAMFNDLGALGNVTSPGAFRGQAMNLYTGGSLMIIGWLVIAASALMRPPREP